MSIADLFRIICCLFCNTAIIITLYYPSNVITGHTEHNRSINNLIFIYKLLGYAALYIFWIIENGSNNFCCNINTHRITLYRERECVPYRIYFNDIRNQISNNGDCIDISEYQ